MSAYSFSSSKSKLKHSNYDSTSGGSTGSASSRLSLGSSYDLGTSRLDTGSSRYDRGSSRLDSLTTKLDTSPSRYSTELDTTSSARASRYDTTGGSSSRFDRTSRYSIEDSGTSRLERKSRYSVTDDGDSTSKLERTSRYSITSDASDLDTAPSRWDRTSSRYITESVEPEASYKRESRFSSRYSGEADLDSSSSRYERSSKLTRGASDISDTASTKYDRTSRYKIEALESEAPSSERYEQRLLAELELDKPSRWDRTSSRYVTDFDTDYSRLDRKHSRLTSVTSESDDTPKYEPKSRYAKEYSELETPSPKWESEYTSQYQKWDTTGTSRLDRQSSRLSTDSTELDTGLSRLDSRTTRALDRQLSKSSEFEADSSYKKTSNLETIQSYGLIAEPIETDTDSSGLVRTSSGIIRASVRRESEPDSEIDSTPTKPKVQKTIKSISQTEGHKATLECEILGYPRPSVQWLKENEVIKSQDRFKIGNHGTTYYLTINDLRTEDNGLYTVAATNSLGTSSSSAAINVLPDISSPRTDSRPTSPGGTFLPQAPKFKVKLKDTDLMDGTTVRFELVVRGMPIPTVTFYKDDEVLKEDHRIRILFESKEVFELMIEHVNEKDQGIYKCVAVNSEGKDETSGRITVTKHKVVFPGIEDEEFVDFTKANSLSPRSRSPVFKWFKDGKEFEASERFQVQFDDEEDTITLVFQHVKPEDAGLYTCAASTSSGKISCSAELTVQGLINQLPRDPIPPTIKLAMSDVEVSEGASAMLEAKVTAYPRPRIRWFRGQELIEVGERYKFLYEDEESYTLVIKNTRKEDQGMYRIEAVNDLGSADTSANLTVNVAPKFKKQMKDQSVMTDECLKLEVEIDANPVAEVKWFRDGKQIKEQKGIKILNEKQSVYDLVIEKVRIEDSGNYSCVATNELGQQTAYSLVTVNAPPVFSSKLESVDALEGQRAELMVKITGNPKPNVKFTKNEKVVKDDGSRISILEEESGTFKLIIKETDSLDSGKYKCIASNEWGEESSEAEITVKKNVMKPNFIKKLRDCEAKVGDQMIEFNVKVEGIPKPEVTWFREGLEVKEKDGFKIVVDEDKQSYTLIIKEVKSESAGTYKCEAVNSEGSVQISGLLTVNTPPKFIKKLEDKTINEGENVKLEVKVIGCPQPDVKWFKGETTIKTTDKRLRYEEESNEFTLTLDNTTTEDSALYKVVAENVFGKCETKGNLKVCSKTTKPIFNQLLTDREAVEYESNVEFVVKTDSQISKPIIKWFINEQEITTSDKRYQLIADEERDTYKLIIKTATEESIGRYKCTATNSSGTADTSAKFNIITKPKFIKGLENVEANEGDTVSMTVKVEGSPEEVKFLKDGRDVSAEATVIVKKEIDDIYILEIENIRIIMSGEYQCLIKNKAGEAFSNGIVVVNSKPKFVKDLEDSESWINENVVLEVVVTGSPTPDITWFKDGKKVDGTQNVILESREEVFKLKLDNATVDDTGVYKCRARNKSGETDSKEAKLKIKEPEGTATGPPVFVKHISDKEVVVGGVVKFEAKIEGKPKPEVVWTKNGIELKPSDKIKIEEEERNVYTLVIKDIQVKDASNIECKAQNSKGQAIDKARLTVQEPESPTISGLCDIAVVEESAAKLEAIITGVPKPIVNWYKDSEPVNEDLIFNEPENNIYSIRFRSVTEDLVGKYVCNASNVSGEAQHSAELSIDGSKPKFIRELDDVITMSVEKDKGKLVLGQSAVFEAEIHGKPTPKVSWLKNGKEMVPDDRVTINNVDHEYTLEIKSIARGDVAQYVCKAVNPHGEAKSGCLLKFMDTPHTPVVIKELPNSVVVEEGQQLLLTAQIDGEPIPSNQWLKNGQPMAQSDDIKIKDRSDGTTSLIVDDVTPEYAGQYSVKAINTMGEITISTEVSVEPPKRKPMFDKELPKNINLEDRQPLELKVKVEALPVAEIKWLKDDTPIKVSDNLVIDQKPDGTQVLSIKKPTSKDSGVYTIRATNECGQTVCSTAVKINGPQMAPTLEKSLPKIIKIEEGKPLELEAKITAEPMPDIKWTKDGLDIKTSDNFKIETKADGTQILKKEKTESKDTGNYEMIASNPLGQISTSSGVDIKPSKPENIFIEKLPEAMRVIEGQPLKLTAKLEDQQKVQWTKDGIPLKPSDGVKIVSEPDGTIALSIDCAKVQNSGQYGLIVKSTKGDVVCSTAVSVSSGDEKKPKIETQLPKVVDVLEGKPLVLTAKIDGQPLPQVKWLKDDLKVEQSDSVKIHTKPDGTVELVIDKSKAQDSGKYALIVENALGEVRSSTDVDVQKGAVITDKLPENVEVVIDKPLVLVAKVDGKPTPKVQWTKDGVPIKATEGIKIETKPDGTVALSVDKAKPETAGEYALIIKSSSGDIVSSTRVDVQKGPIILNKLPDYVDVIVGGALNLAAKILSDSKPEVKWTKDGVPIKETEGVRVETKPDGTVELCISNAQPNDTGKYALIAKTPSGETTSESAVDVQSGPIFREQLPEYLNVTEGKPVDLFARVDGNPLPEVNWTKDGVQIEPTKETVIKAKPDGAISLFVESALLSDSGKYAAIAKNPCGEVVSITEVEVKKGPVIKELLPEYLTFSEGKPFVLMAKSEGTPIKSMQWSKDGKPIKMTDGIKVETQPNGNIWLSVECAKPSDAGRYELMIKTPNETLITSSNVNVVKSKAKEPQIIANFAEVLDVIQGKPLVLTAKVEGEPFPDVKWLKDDVPIEHTDSIKIETKPDGTVSLEVGNAEPQDSGIYSLVVENTSTILKKSCDVDVSKGPLISQRLPEKIELVIGKPLILTAKVEGVPASEVKWTKNGVPIKLKDGVKVETKPDGTVLLNIDKARSEDAGEYAMIAKSKTGDLVSSSKVEVQKGPIIVEKLPHYVDAIVGKPVHLVAKVDGLPEPIVKWTKDSKRIEPSEAIKIESQPDGTVSLTIECAQPLDLGKYAVIAKNSIGEAVSECDVDVQTGPIIREKLPETLKITEGKPFELVAKVDGSPMPEVQWTKDGVHIEPMEGIEIKTKDDGTVALSIDCAQTDDTGRYAIIAKSPTGEIVSKSEVEVKKGPILKEMLPEFVKIDQGQPMKLIARVEGQPIIEVKWAKDGVPIEGSDTILMETKPNGIISLNIESTQPLDAGKYALIIQTPDQDLKTCSDVNVIKSHSKMPELVTKFPETVDVVEGKPLTLSAKIIGEPKPEIHWLKDDYPLEVSKSVKMETKPDGSVALIIGSAQPKDSGKYTLIAENPLGEVRASTEVGVEKGPVIAEKLPENIDVVVGKPLTLTAKVSGEPKPTIEWTKDGVPITETDAIKFETKPDGTVELKIEMVKPENTGQYALIAKSPLGEVTSLSNVDVLTGPVFITKLPESIDVIAGNDLNLVAKVDAQQSPLVKWLKDDIRVEPSDHIKLESKLDGTVSLSIDCAQLNDTGKYAVVAKTRDGEDVSSSNVFVQKGPVIIEGLPETVSLLEGKPLNLNAKFDGKPSPDVTWFKDNIPIKSSDGVEIKCKPDGSTSLTIGSAQAKDSGEYAVIAKSPSGEAMSLSNVEVKKGPVFTQKLPEAVKVITGKPITLVAKIDGLPQQQPKYPIVTWVKDGYPIVFTEKVKLGTKPNGTVCLSIDCAKPKDIGKYAVVAKTPDGEIVSATSVSVLNPPTFKDSLPKMLNVVEGKPLRLSAKIDSDSIPEIIWTKDGVPLKSTDGAVMKTKPDGTVVLEIGCAKNSDSGHYAVLAKTQSGEAKSGCDVSVQKGLIIIDNLPHSVSVCEGKPLILKAKIDGKPPPEVTWIKDGITLKPSEGLEIRSKPDGTYMLTIGSVKPADTGEYVMIARNPVEEVVAVTNVDVEIGPVVSEKLPEKISVVVGKPLELMAKIECDSPIDKIIWTKDGIPIRSSEDHKLKQRPDGTVCLNIDCAKLSDSGKYAVFAKVGNRGVGSMSVVTVTDEPTEKKPEEEKPEEEESTAEFKEKLPKNLTVREGSPLKLVAKIARKGERIPTFSWTKNSFNVEDTDRVKRETTPNGTVSLKIESALLSDAGTYCLSFKNEDGIQNTTVTVQITPKSTVEQPVFIKGLTRITAEEGKPCRLEAKISGDIDSIIWYRNGEKILANEHFGLVRESDGTIALLIDSTKFDDSGEYRVEVINNAGTAESSASLKVNPKPKEKPIFIDELKPTMANQRERLVLKAIYKSDLPVTIKWMKDGFDIQASDRIQLSQTEDGTLTLTIESANLDDSGKYSVSVINEEGRIRSTGAVTISSKADNKPDFVEGLIATTLTAGQMGKLSVKASGEPMPEVRFIKDGQQVIPNDRVHIKGQLYGKTELVFDVVKPEDEGNYIAVAVNDNGEVRSSAPVVVNRMPTFEKRLTDTTGIEGYPARLEIKVDGRPKPDIKWTKNGQSLVPDDYHIKLYSGGDGTYALIFDTCIGTDSGTYGVVATNELGKTESSAQFLVKSKVEDTGPESAPVFISSLQDVSVHEGQIIEFTAQIKASPIPDIKWYLNGQEIEASDNIQISFDGTKAKLKITKCEAKHKGVYELKVSNHLGVANSKAKADIIGKTAPKFIETFRDSEVGLTEKTKLVCRVTGFPEPNIEWYCNGIRVEPGIHYSIIRELEVCSLVIVRATEKLTGVYECRAKNECGSDSCKANITFIDSEAKGEAASFLKKLSDCEVREGKTAKFTACVTGSPKPEIKWFKEGIEFEPLSSPSKYSIEYQSNGLIRFEIRCVEQIDLGEYRCHTMNIYGYDNSIASLKFESLDDKHKRRPSTDKLSDKFKKPSIPVPLPDRPRITRMSDSDLTLAWLPSIPIQPRIPVTYIVEFSRIPDGEWIAYRTGIKDSQCDIDGLSPGDDYSFRTRVENKFGISDPSPFVTAHRSKLRPQMDLGDRTKKGYDVGHIPMDKSECAPRFLREHETYIYGIRGEPVTLEFWIYAHPDPHVHWQFEGQKIETGSATRFDTLQDRGGQNNLFISKMTESDCGWYTCVATNSLGTEMRKVKLEYAEPPVFTRRFEEKTVLSRQHARFECTVEGKPEPIVRWFKDWQPLAESDRIKILWETPDRATLLINSAIVKDSGLYSCSASNIAGHASISAMLHIEESELEYDKYTFGYSPFIKPKTKPFETFYDIGDELGRGTQGISYHSVERSTGKSFASKMMHGKGQMRDYMMAELDVMNQLGYHPRVTRLWDAFTSTPNSLTLITDLCGGGELLHNILQRGTLTESDVALYVRQILEGIEYLHFKNIAHFGLTIGDILLERVNGNDIKIADYGLAQRIIPGIRYIIEFGHPEFVAPEILDKQSASYMADVWSVGIITYILLTGISPFLGENDRSTLQHLQLGKIDFSHEMLTEISFEGKDFLTKVLEFDQYKRLDVKSALQHPWLRMAERPGTGAQLNCMENLRQYHRRFKNWYVNASCKTHYRRRALHSCFTHPSRMIYPPDEKYTPPPSPERELRRSKFMPSQFDETYRQKISREGVDAHSESQYQQGPDTYLLQLRDTDFATRIRGYLRVGASRSPSLAASLRESHWGDHGTHTGYKPSVSVRERRKFTDIMDEEVGEEKRGLETRSKPMRLVREVGTSGYAYGQLHHLKREAFNIVSKDTGIKSDLPFFREKIKDIVIKDSEDVVFSCLAVGDPTPSYTWFRNDGILIESSRIEVKRTEDGRCELRIKPARAYDVGHYKCVARNQEGAVVCRARLKLGDVPNAPDAPEIKDGSDKEVYLCWSPPRHDGNSHILCYRLEVQKPNDNKWTVIADNIMHEFFIARDLETNTSYYFRISARNRFGWSAHSNASEMVKTVTDETKRLKVPRARIYRQTVTEDVGRVIVDDQMSIPIIDYSKELNPIQILEEEHNKLYDFLSEIARGRFSMISNTRVKDINKILVSKAVLTQSETESGIKNEYEIMKTLANERIVELLYASRGSTVFALVMEKLSGIDVLTYLSQRQKYNEELVSKIILQVLDGIEYLHFRGICILELQPDNVVMVDQRRHDIKLCDFANARRVPLTGTRVSIIGCPEYVAPELIRNEEVTTAADIWCVGVLTYILLSGVSPFRGSNENETAQNVVYVRYLFDHLYPEITQEAMRFLLTVFKLTPHKRPTIEECADHKWLLPNEFMIKKRESAIFSSHKLTEFADEFHSVKSSSTPARLINFAGSSLARSVSLQNDSFEEL